MEAHFVYNLLKPLHASSHNVHPPSATIPLSPIVLPLKPRNTSNSEELTLCRVRDIDVEGEAVLGLIGEKGGLLPGQVGGPARRLRRQLRAHRTRALRQ